MNALIQAPSIAQWLFPPKVIL